MRALLAGLVLFLGACSLHMDVPDGFLRLTESERGDVRAVTSDEARIWVREFAVGYGPGIQFWSDALVAELRDRRGYTIEDTGEVEDGAGHKGRMLEGEVDVDGQRCGYLLAVFPLGAATFGSETVRTVEFTAPLASYEERIAAVKAAMATVR